MLLLISAAKLQINPQYTKDMGNYIQFKANGCIPEAFIRFFRQIYRARYKIMNEEKNGLFLSR